MKDRKYLPQMRRDYGLLDMDFDTGNKNSLVRLEDGKIMNISQNRDVEMYRMNRVTGNMEEEYIHMRDSRTKTISVSHEVGYFRNFFKKII